MTSEQPPTAGDRRLRGLLLVALLLLFALLWALLSWSSEGASAGSGDPGPRPTPTVTATGGGGTTVTTPEGRTFTLTATVTAPLLPGRPGALRVVADNPAPVALRLTEVTVAVLPPATAGCSAEWLRIAPWTGDMPLPAGGTATVDLAAELLDLPDVDQSACRGGVFPLRLTGSGREAP
jgi:hypothetical protein